MNEMPQLMSSSYGSTSAPVWGALAGGAAVKAGAPKPDLSSADRFVDAFRQVEPAQPIAKEQQKMTSRIVKVFMADTDENVPAEKRILYIGEEKFTDSTDQELFFEIPVQELLSKHNALRLTLTDKKASAKAGKDVMLEPLRIRDLRMVVVNVAQF